MITFGIILLLVALILPALGVAREAARRTQCQNNLKQVSLALVHYHEHYGGYPPGYVSRDVSAADDWTAETGPGYAWSMLLLDFLDQSPLAATVSCDLDATDPANLSAMSTVISAFRCPSGDTPPTFNVAGELGTYMLSSSNYVGMYGVGDLTESPGQPAGPGAFYRNSHTTTWRIPDGLSNTILVAERSAWHDFEEPSSGGVSADSTWFAVIPGATRPAGVNLQPSMRVGPASLVLGTVGLNTPGFETLRPNHTNHIAAFSSNHVGGLNTMLGDSSIRFTSDQIDERVLRALAQTHDGDVAGEF